VNAFLVLFVHTMDDIPIGLFSTHAEAVAFGMDQPRNLEVPRWWPADCSTPVHVAVVEFIDGKPNAYVIIKDFTR
jgi:hypothetical protein